MKKELLVIIIIAFILIGIALARASGLSNDDKIDKKILDNLKNNNITRVMIYLNNTGVEGIQFTNIKKDILASASGTKIRNDFGNIFSMDVSGAELENLAKNNNIKEIKQVRILKLVLHDSVRIINATMTWPLEINGINLTGQGQAICILDTGVNYTQPDLGGCSKNTFLAGNCSKVLGGYNFVDKNNNPMDDDGHGTHVSGIIAANGTIIGIAPGASLVMVRVCDSSGCYEDDIRKGLDWCTGNASNYNISAISMSLGTDEVYTNYCDYNSDTSDITDAINRAVAKNISVVIATGNSASSTGIAFPACVKNATRVGASDKTDAIADFSNRNNITLLFAPGVDITSVRWNNVKCNPDCTCSGGSMTCSGTSMATPMVSGAIAIINQFLKMNGQTKTPRQIELTMNNTGKAIHDSASGLDFSRINIYNSIISLDNNPPNVALVSPDDNAVYINNNANFRCNASNLALSNITFYLWNSTDLVNYSLENITGQSYTFDTNISNLDYENYKWNCLAYDLNGNLAFASSNYSFSISNISVILSKPTDNIITNQADINFSCNSSTNSDYEISNVTFYLWNSTNQIHYETINTSGAQNITTFNYNLSENGNYLWNCIAQNNDSLSGMAYSNRTVIYDLIAPNITLESPSDGSSYTGSQTLLFVYKVSDITNVSRCDLIINNVFVKSNSSAIINGNTANNFSDSLGIGTYSWSINCSDYAGNEGISGTRTFTINSGGGGSPGGGGGGCTGTCFYSSFPPNNTVVNASTNASNSSNQTGSNENINIPSNKTGEGRKLRLFGNEVNQTGITGIILGAIATIVNNNQLIALSIVIIVCVGISIVYFLKSRIGRNHK